MRKNAAYEIKISLQEVKNEIESFNLDNKFYPENNSKRQVKNVYVIAHIEHFRKILNNEAL